MKTVNNQLVPSFDKYLIYNTGGGLGGLKNDIQYHRIFLVWIVDIKTPFINKRGNENFPKILFCASQKCTQNLESENILLNVSYLTCKTETSYPSPQPYLIHFPPEWEF